MVAKHKDRMLQSSAIVENVLEELKSRHTDFSVKDLLQGRIQVYSTADAAGAANRDPGVWNTACCFMRSDTLAPKD